MPNLTGETLKGDDKINLRTKTLYFINDEYLLHHQEILVVVLVLVVMALIIR